MYDIHYQGVDEFEISPQLSGVLNKIESIPEWWKDYYKIPANDERWLRLTSDQAHEDYLRHSAKILLQLLKDRYNFKTQDAATIMSKSIEEMKEEVKNIQNWIIDDNENLQKAIDKVGFNSKKLEVEIYGKELSNDEKEDLIRQRMLKVMRDHFGEEDNTTQETVVEQ